MPSVAPSPSPIVLGRYELHSVIAMGGMASVHFGRVRGAAGFARTVAIKRLHPHFARDASFVAMFMDEARLVARIQHPNVVAVLDVVAEEGELFLVMEYVHGESLARLVHARKAHREAANREAELPMAPALPMPPAVAAKTFADVLHGLHAAHGAKAADGEPLGIVHRDVTPHNVIVGLDGTAKIADFGIAKATQRASHTRDGELKGKLCYVAPEQLTGDAVGREADVYAAATSLWEALTGRVLFEADHEARIVEKILIGAMHPPSALAPGIPAALDEIVMRGLEMKPHKRFPTAREMALALEHCIALPPASEIGAWVETRAGAALAERAGRIERIERAPSAPPPHALAAAPSAPPPAAATLTDVRSATPPARRPYRERVPLALTAVVAVAAALGWLHARPAPSAAPLAAPVSVAPDVVPAIPEPPPAPPDSLPRDAPVAPKPFRASGRAPARTSVGDARAGAVDDACRPPYTRDETGHKIYKRECL